MRKIPSLFCRNYESDRLVRDEVVPGCEWVLRGEGVATRKFDGTCCAVIGGEFVKRYEVRRGKQPPDGFIPAQEPDPVTGEVPGWVPVGEGREDRWHREAWEAQQEVEGVVPDWTYELVGPRIQGNKDAFTQHTLVPHGKGSVLEWRRIPRTFDGIRDFLAECRIEGIVWWRDLDDLHCDKVKIKRKDFGLRW